MRFLLVSPYLPHSAIGHGGGIATYQFARELARRHELHVLCFERTGESEAKRDLGDQGVRVQTVPYLSVADRGPARVALYADRLRALWRSRRRGEPLQVSKYWREAMLDALRTQLQHFDPEVVQFEYTALARYAEWLSRTRPRVDRPAVILNTHEAGVLPRRRRLEAARGKLEADRARAELRRWQRHELRACASADLIQCVTEQDREVYVQLGADPARLWTQPLGVELDSLPQAVAPTATAPRLLFVGSFGHLPNREAALWLLREYWPRVRGLHPSLRLDIVGANPPEELRRLAAQEVAVRIHGFVADLDPLFDGATLFLAPLFSGGGIKIKILEALGRGSPVLSSAIGLEGIDAEVDTHCWLADDLDAFVRLTERALAEPGVAHAMGQRAREQVGRRYAWPRLVDDLERKLAELRATGATD